MATPTPEMLLDSLVDHGVVAIDEETDTVRTTDEFEGTRELYHDIYVEVSEAEFERTVADLFDLDPADAGAVIEEREITREQIIAFLALRSHIDDPVPATEVAMMAAAVTELGPGSAVPDSLREITDESYGEFLDANPDAVVTVWKRYCDPCEAMKGELDDVLERVPAGIPVAGLEHVPPSAFRREFRVDAAPAVLLFRGGEVVEKFEGRTDPSTLGEAMDAVYRSD